MLASLGSRAVAPVVDPGVLATAGLHGPDVLHHVPHRDVALVIRVDLVVQGLEQDRRTADWWCGVLTVKSFTTGLVY